MLVYQKNYLALLQNINDDPVKTALIIQQEEGQYNAAAQELQTEMQNAKAMQGFSFGTSPKTNEGAMVALLNVVLGINTARAQWVVFDPAIFGSGSVSSYKMSPSRSSKTRLWRLSRKRFLRGSRGAGAAVHHVLGNHAYKRIYPDGFECY